MTRIAKKLDMDMCARPLFGKIILFSLPLIATGILQLLYNAADIIVVGRFDSSDAMAAVGSTGPLVNLIINLFIGLSVGTLTCTAQAIGAHDHESCDKIVHTSMLISVIGGIIVALVGFFMSKYFLVWMGTPQEVLPLSQKYLEIFFLGMPFNLVYNFGSSIMRACGDTKRPLIFLLISGVANVGLNLLFVIVFKMSVAGVALATIIAQAISAALVVIYLIKRKGYGKLKISHLRIHKVALIKIMKIGLPAGIQSTIFSMSNVIIQSSINSMGNIAMAGNAAAANIEGFVYTSMNSVSQACLTFTGQNYGANKRQNTNFIMLQSLALATAVGLVMGISVYLGGNWIVRLYNTDPQVIHYAVERLSIIGCTYFLCGIMEVAVGALRGIGKSILPMIVSIVGVCGIRILWIFTVFKFNNTPIMLYLSYPVSWTFTFVVHMICWWVARKDAWRRLEKLEIKVEPTALDISSNSDGAASSSTIYNFIDGTTLDSMNDASNLMPLNDGAQVDGKDGNISATSNQATASSPCEDSPCDTAPLNK